MFAVTVQFDIDPDQMETFLGHIVENAKKSRATEPGCQHFDVCQTEDRIFLYEIYDDAAAFDAHLATAHFKALDATVASMVLRKEVTTYERVLR